MHYLAHPDSPINFAKFIERHKIVLDSLLVRNSANSFGLIKF